AFKHPLYFNGWFPQRFQTVGAMNLDHHDLMGPPTVCKHTTEIQRFKGGATPYEAFFPGGWTKFVSEEEAKSLFPRVDIGPDKGEVEKFVRQMLPELRQIEVPPEDRWTPPKLKEPEVPDLKPVLVEVHFQCDPEEMNMEADEIAEELGDDLMVNGLGSMMTMDSAGVDSRFEVILEVPRHRLKGALTQIRKTLKRLKAPSTTRLIEVADTGPVEHPLVAPAKGGG
ncbi:MAG: hypothetical protein ABL994_22230, partial [Verrucomicrobiales bacterium]